MAQVKGYTRRGKRGQAVAVRSYTNRKPARKSVYVDSSKKESTVVWEPQEKTAALYDPNKQNRPFRGRIARGQKTPSGLKHYAFDNTELGQAPKNKRALTEGRTKAY